MKKGLFLIPLAAAMMASCSNDDFDGNNGGFTGETEINYIAVNIVDVADNATRADDDYNNRTDYENGKDAENEVKSIRFYLFKADGTPFSTNYVDATAEEETPSNTDTPNPNVEKKLQAVIVFEAEKSDDESVRPAQIVAVLNPPTGLGDIAKVDEVQTQVANYCTGLTTSGTFVMTNAVYLDDKNEEHVAYQITKNDVKDSKAAALADPVEIYVERVVAKARVSLVGLTEATAGTLTNVYKLAGDSGKAIIYNPDGSTSEKEIYLQLLGWNVTGTAPKSRLVKKIEEGWGSSDNTNFVWGLNNEWNLPAYHRSFWALNPTDVNSQAALQFGNFNGSGQTSNNGVANLNPAVGVGSSSFGSASTKGTEIYMQENASWEAAGTNPGYGTKLIVAGRLVDNEGNQVNLGWYAGSYYLKETLKQVMLSNAKIFKKTGDSNSTTYSPVTTTEIPVEFKTTTAAGDFDAAGNRQNDVSDQVNRYNSYAYTTTTSVTPETYYIKKNDGTYEALTSVEDINAALKGVGTVKLWDSGYTYYWLDITHLAPADKYGSVGIVRNHIYDYEISSFTGFGIPVLDPSETIYPETPNDPEMMYIAARINILSWRLVNHSNTELGW